MLAPSRPFYAALILASTGFGQDATDAAPDGPTGPGRGTLEERQIQIGETEREYLLHLPKRLGREGEDAVPLVVMMHGRSSNMRAASSVYYGWRKLADRERFVVAFPNARGRPRSWRPAWGRPSADAPFLRDLIETLVEEFPIDPDRVYLTGHSSGGIMSFSFAATHPDKVAAIGPVAGTIGYGEVTIPAPSSPVPVISIHGTSDNIVPYDQDGARSAAYGDLVTAPRSMAFWVEHNGCEQTATRTTTEDGRVHIDVWEPEEGGARVELHSIIGGGHGWPGLGRDDYPATRKIWEFFERVERERRDQAESSGPAKAAEPQEGNGRRDPMRV